VSKILVIVVDALDECTDINAVRDFLKVIRISRSRQSPYQDLHHQQTRAGGSEDH
jgi:hypothetical protein